MGEGPSDCPSREGELHVQRPWAGTQCGAPKAQGQGGKGSRISPGFLGLVGNFICNLKVKVFFSVRFTA